MLLLLPLLRLLLLLLHSYSCSSNSNSCNSFSNSVTVYYNHHLLLFHFFSRGEISKQSTFNQAWALGPHVLLFFWDAQRRPAHVNTFAFAEDLSFWGVFGAASNVVYSYAGARLSERKELWNANKNAPWSRWTSMTSLAAQWCIYVVCRYHERLAAFMRPERNRCSDFMVWDYFVGSMWKARFFTHLALMLTLGKATLSLMDPHCQTYRFTSIRDFHRS